VLRIDDAGRSVFISGTLFLSWIAAALLIVATSGGLFGMTVRSDVLAASRLGHFLRTIDRPAQKLAQLMSPIRDFDTMEGLVRHERILMMGRWWTFVGLCMLVIITGLLLNLVL